jgi:hypothetical protein
MREKIRWVVWYPAALGLVSTLFVLPLSAESASARGVWLASIDFGSGLSRKLVLELEERGDGRLIGYILGGTSQRTVVSGRRIGKDVNLELELKTITVTRHVTIWGRIAGGRITGSASDGGSSRSIVLDPIRGTVHERRFLLGVPASTGAVLIGEMAVALDDIGSLLAGTWVAALSCATLGCDGEITAFDEISSAPVGSTTLSFKFPNREGCADESSAELAFDQVTRTYSGWYQLGTCTGYVGGALLGVRTTRTQSDHVSQILQGLGRLADDHESGRAFSELHFSFSPDYLEYGHHLADLLFLYNAENATYKHIEAAFNRVSLVTTVPESFGNFFGETPPPFGAVFEERRSGTPSTGSTPITYVDTTTQERHPWLRVWRPEAGRWVIYGSQSPGLDLPFQYSVGPKSLEVPFGASDDVGTIHVSPGSFGAHFEPLTGHGFGNAKIDFVGFFTASDADLSTFSDGRGYYGGTGGSLLLQHRPVYISPADGLINSIECSPGTPEAHLGESDWKIGLELSTHEGLSIDLGRLAPNLEDTLRAMGISLSTCSVSTGNLITGSIPISRDEEIGYPQVIAHRLPSHPSYFGGGDWFPDRPWVYMEFFLTSVSGEDSAVSCYYGFRPLRQQQGLQAALTADMLDPDSQRYWSSRWPRYEWQAESRLCMAPSKQPTDFSDLYTRLGGWFESNADGVTSPDEIVSFSPIAKDEGTAYDPRLYDSRAVDMLVLRRKPRGAGCVFWPVPDGTSVGTTNCDSAGEILERTPDSLLIKWHVSANPYQRAAYILDPVNGLKISWGGFTARAADAILPTLTPGTPCNGTTIVCYDHTDRPGF